MRNSWHIAILCVTLFVFLIIGACGVAWAASVPPGGYGSGCVTLVSGLDKNEISIEKAPTGTTSLILERGTTATADDSMIIKTNAPWKLTVEDKSADSANALGYMKPFVSGAFVLGENNRLTNKFAVLVEGIGENDGVLNDAIDLSNGPVEIMQGSSTENLEKTLYIKYSQRVSGNEIAGDYRIDLIYTLSISV